jgi:hypothetical protein
MSRCFGQANQRATKKRLTTKQSYELSRRSEGRMFQSRIIAQECHVCDNQCQQIVNQDIVELMCRQLAIVFLFVHFNIIELYGLMNHPRSYRKSHRSGHRKRDNGRYISCISVFRYDISLKHFKLTLPIYQLIEEQVYNYGSLQL